MGTTKMSVRHRMPVHQNVKGGSKTARAVFCSTNGITYPSVADAATKLKISPTSIRKMCRENTTTVKGISCSYAAE